MSNKRKLPSPQKLSQSGQAQDSAYFKKHPTATSYTRPATAEELKLTGFPPGTMVHVNWDGISRIRGFIPPSVEKN